MIELLYTRFYLVYKDNRLNILLLEQVTLNHQTCLETLLVLRCMVNFSNKKTNLRTSRDNNNNKKILSQYKYRLLNNLFLAILIFHQEV